MLRKMVTENSTMNIMLITFTCKSVNIKFTGDEKGKRF